MSSVISDYGIPSLSELEAFVSQNAQDRGIVPLRRASSFALSPSERARPVSFIVRETSSVAARAMTADPLSCQSSAALGFDAEPLTERPVLLVGRGIDPAQEVLRPLPGYRDWIEHPDVKTPAVDAMKIEIVKVQELVLSRGVSLHDISQAIGSGSSIKELAGETEIRVAFAPQIEEVIPDGKKRCCIIQ